MLSQESAQQIAVPVSLLSVRQRHSSADVSLSRERWGPRPPSHVLFPEILPVPDRHGDMHDAHNFPVGPQMSGMPTLHQPPTPVLGFFQLGASFPFLSSSSLPPLSSSFSPRSRSRSPRVRSQTYPAPEIGLSSEISSCSAVPPEVPCPVEVHKSRLFSSLGSWISAKGGRKRFVRWLMGECDQYLAEDWRELDPDSVWTRLNSLGNACSLDWGSQTTLLLEANLDRADTVLEELYGIMSEAQSLLCSEVSSVGVTRGKRSCPSVVEGSFNVGSTRCQRRNIAKKAARLLKRRKRAKQKRRLACFRTSGPVRHCKKGKVVIGTWNTRGLGAPTGKDPEGKIRALFSLMLERKWNAALLTDVRFNREGVSQVTVKGANWLIVHYGKVAVALDEWLACRWRRGGAVLTRVKGWPDGERCFGLRISGEGWRPGLLLAPVYAPVSSRTPLEQRDKFRDRVSAVIDAATYNCRLILGGDFNGEVGATKDTGGM